MKHLAGLDSDHRHAEVAALACTGFLLSTFLLACSPAGDEQATAANADQQGPGQQTAAVAMPDHYAAEVAEQIMRAGGNAVDPGIAAGFALAVSYPEAGNIGGGGFMLIRMNDTDGNEGVGFRRDCIGHDVLEFTNLVATACQTRVFRL